MDTLLVVVTLVSLGIGLSMAVIAWKLLRDARARSAARIDALEAMAFAAPPIARDAHAEFTEDFLVEDEGGGDEQDWDLPIAITPPAVREGDDRRQPAAVPVGASRLFDAPPAPGAGGRRALAFATVALVMLAGFGGVYALRSADLLAPSAIAARFTATGERSLPPLELTSLRNDVTVDGEFIVTGLVHNPVAGMARHGVVAVVYLFDQDGHYFASGRAALDLAMFPPGDESPFVVRIPGGAGAARYRVGFRQEDGGVVAHVDRRSQAPAGATGDTLDAVPAVGPIGQPRRSES